MFGIIGAMQVEIDGLLAKMDRISTEIIAGMDFHIGKFNGADVVVAKCRVGKVNAAMCAQAMIDRFSINSLINLGVAGGLLSSLKIGDVVVSQDLVQHDVDACAFGYKIGEIPGLVLSSFPANEKMIETAIGICLEVLAENGNDAKVGRIATGDQFVTDKIVKKHILDTFGAYCVEMEGAAIAQVCYLNKIPFVAIRAISDNADGSAEEDFLNFVERAAQNSSKIVERLIGLM